MSTRRPGSRGVALVEALVAMAVMAFGMLAIVGVQSTLRLNSDTAKQRSEAVRIAQAAIDQRRSFSVLDAAAGVTAYADITNFGPSEVAGTAGQNTTFVRTDTVVISQADPRMRTLSVDVTWADRAGTPQVVRLSSVIAGVQPELAGSLGLPMQRSLTSQPGGRNPGIPIGATPLPNGTSAFKPPQPGGGTVVWVFNNITGLFTVCGTTAGTTAEVTLENIIEDSCGPDVGQLLSGQVRFATGDTQPNAAEAENPVNSLALNLDVELDLTSLNHPDPGSTCFDDAPETLAARAGVLAVNYYCAILANPQKSWSGISSLIPRAFSDADQVVWAIGGDGGYKVCRYTPAANDAADIPNAAHPRAYSNVTKPLTRQNFLVISAANNCPTDAAADPLNGNYINSNTLVHQPAPA